MVTSAKKISLAVGVRIIDGPHGKESFSFEKLSFTIGRGAENDIILPNDPKLSRNQLKVLCLGDRIMVENLSPKNPLFFKGKEEKKIELNPGDKIKVGETEIEFTWETEPGDRTVRIGAETLAQLQIDKTSSTSDSIIKSVTESSLISTSPIPIKYQEFNSILPLQQNQEKIIKNPELKGALYPLKNGIPEVLYKPTSAGKSSINKTETNPKNLSGIKQKVGNKNINHEKTKGNPILLLVLVVIIVIGIFIYPEESKKSKKITHLKDTDQIKVELGQSAQNIENYIKERHLLENGQTEKQFESAQSYYIKGFRDYRQGQYSRAIMSFQAALSFDPNHILSIKYLNQSIKKHSEFVQFSLDQARRYRQKNNFRLCRSSAKQVMTLRRDQNDPQYKDAKGLFEECDTLSRGRF